MTRQVISANRLTDGLVVYMTEDGGWSERIDEALLFDKDSDGEAATAKAAESVAAQRVVDPYPIDIDETGGTRRPTRYREYIRAMGPTVRRDLGKQATPDAVSR